MEFYKVLESLMKNRNLSIPDIARATGLSDSTLRSIISRKTKNISLEVAFKLSQGLNVSLEELNGDKEISKVNSSANYSEEEQQHIEDLRKLNDIGKDKVINYTKDLIEMPKYQKESNITELTQHNLTYNDFNTIAAHNDNLTDEEISEVDRRILEDINRKR